MFLFGPLRGLRVQRDYKTSCPDLDFWVSLRGGLARIKQDSTVDDSKWMLAEEVHGNLSEIFNHLDKLTGQVSIDCRLTLACASTDILVHNSKVLYDMAIAALQQCSHALVAYWFKNFRDFVKQQLYLGGGKLFGIIAKSDKECLSVKMVDESNNVLEPKEFLELQANKLKTFWTASDEHREVVAALFKQCRKYALEDGPRTYDLETLDKGLEGYNKGSLGADLWHPNELRSLPWCCRSKVAEGIDRSFQRLAWPHQHVLSLSPLLGKPTGGTRAITKTPMLYRISLRGLGGAKEWESEFTQTYDKAKRGSSALLTALCRGLRAEIAKYINKVPAAVFNDMEKISTHLISNNY